MKSWAIWIAIAVGVYIYKTASEADRDSTGAIVGGGSVDAFHMQIGDCFNDSNALLNEGEFSSVPGVPCSEPHDNEVYAVFDLSVASYPGREEMEQLAFDSCLERFEPFVGRDYESSSLDIFPMFPTQESWDRFDDREVICGVYDINLEKLQGSVKGLSL